MPPLELQPWEVMLILRLRQMRKNGVKSALVHLQEPSIHSIGQREKLVDKDDVKSYPKDNSD